MPRDDSEVAAMLVRLERQCRATVWCYWHRSKEWRLAQRYRILSGMQSCPKFINAFMEAYFPAMMLLMGMHSSNLVKF